MTSTRHTASETRLPAPLDAGRLRLLREAALRGSISAASRTLGLTPSAVSQQLAALEREVGMPLLDRSPRGATLTGAGRALVARAEQVADVLAAARADIERLTGVRTGRVAVSCVASAAISFVSDGLSRLEAEQPGIDVSITCAEPAVSLDLLISGDADLAIVDEYDYVPVALPDHTEARELLTEPLVAIVPAGSSVPIRPHLTDLAAARWVMPPDDAACGRALRSACRAAGFEPDVRWESDDLLVLVRAVSAGHGVAVIPRLSVHPDTAAVEMRTLRRPGLQRRLIAVARSSALARPAVAEVLDALTLSAKTV
ncbi:LysR family transcriptional regulator [Leekyejoonella antrihumi]|uniref:LysR family transcriptional regulator n=1 Tax=Leekyejoonella antrihumi TaxID=1660198 RepID=A0A563E7L7_9MICO|nr:LysR family transcriptional regulator [Leekyejoonella antrihumi]TWP38578.1 LysR family transcriptional regulator [Leekyejoonella antrihumi]